MTTEGQTRTLKEQGVVTLVVGISPFPTICVSAGTYVDEKRSEPQEFPFYVVRINPSVTIHKSDAWEKWTRGHILYTYSCISLLYTLRVRFFGGRRVRLAHSTAHHQMSEPLPFEWRYDVVDSIELIYPRLPLVSQLSRTREALG